MNALTADPPRTDPMASVGHLTQQSWWREARRRALEPGSRQLGRRTPLGGHEICYCRRLSDQELYQTDIRQHWTSAVTGSGGTYDSRFAGSIAAAAVVEQLRARADELCNASAGTPADMGIRVRSKLRLGDATG